jgi:hypothetical protein
MPDKTHRQVKSAQISARFLADYMAGSEQARRTIARGCKYQSKARVIQHDEAKRTVGKFMREGLTHIGTLAAKSEELRNRLADGPFDRDLFDHNADYIDRFALVASKLTLPKADRIAPGPTPAVDLMGVKVTPEIQFRFVRTTSTNKVRIGGVMLRYAKGKPLSPTVAAWQSAFLFGYLKLTNLDESAEAEHKLCLTVDAYTGICYPAPTDAVSRFNNMKAACATIAERWPMIEPPPGAIL